MSDNNEVMMVPMALYESMVERSRRTIFAIAAGWGLSVVMMAAVIMRTVA